MDYALLIALLVCHYVADYCLTTPKMLAAKAAGEHVQYIAAHAAVHAVLMGVVMVVRGVSPALTLALMAVEWGTHFAIDYFKGALGRRYPSCADNRQKSFWMLYGLDQLLHQLVIVVMVWVAAR